MDKNLHSTMYLLNPAIVEDLKKADMLFTFHYVSIKSRVLSMMRKLLSNLHSTMYLLNQQ